MKRSLLIAAFATLLAFTSLASARDMHDIKDGKLMIQPKSDTRFSVEGNIMGKAQLFGYVSDLKDHETFDSIVIGEGADDAQRNAIRSIANTLQLKPFVQTGSELTPIGD